MTDITEHHRVIGRMLRENEGLCGTLFRDERGAGQMCIRDWPCGLHPDDEDWEREREVLRHVIAKATYTREAGGLLSTQFHGWTPEQRYQFAEEVIARYEAARYEAAVENANNERTIRGGQGA